MTEPVSLITHGCVTKDPTSWHFKGAHTSCLWVPVGEALGCSSAGSSGSRPLTISPALPSLSGNTARLASPPPSAAFHPSEQVTLEGKGQHRCDPHPQEAGAAGVAMKALATLTLESIKAGKVNVLRRLRGPHEREYSTAIPG